LLRNPKEASLGGKGGQDSHRVVELMMMLIISIILTFILGFNTSDQFKLRRFIIYIEQCCAQTNSWHGHSLGIDKKRDLKNTVYV
jgi:hypothetical protein